VFLLVLKISKKEKEKEVLKSNIMNVFGIAVYKIFIYFLF
jgi:hypothetical protein